MKADRGSEAASRKPRYLELAEDLRGQIQNGRFQAINQFPTESVLCKHYNVSRFTVREALRLLQTEGLIQRRRGSGTVIQSPAARGGTLYQPLSNVGEILQYANDTRFTFARAGSVALPTILAKAIGIGATGCWAHFRGIRSSATEDRPIAATDAYIHPDLIAAADEIVPDGPTIFQQLETLSDVKIARVTQDIQAVPANAAIAVALGVARRSPCLRILRCYCDGNGRVIELSASYHPGDRFAYSMHIEVER